MSTYCPPPLVGLSTYSTPPLSHSDLTAHQPPSNGHLNGEPQSWRVSSTNSKAVSDRQWTWLRQIFVVVRRLFDAAEVLDTVSRIHWLNVGV